MIPTLVFFLTGCSTLTANTTSPQLSNAELDRADLLSERLSLRTGDFDMEDSTTNDAQAFVQSRGSGQVTCDDAIAVFDYTAAVAGAVEPTQFISCPAHLPDARDSRFSVSLDVRDDLLAAGPYLYRRTGAGWQFEALLGGGTPVSGGRTMLLGSEHAATFANDLLYIFEKGADGWTNIQRIDTDSGASSWDRSDGDMFVVRTGGSSNSRGVVYARGADGLWALQDTGTDVRAIHNGHAIDVHGTLYRWTGTDLESTGVGVDLDGVAFGVGSANRNYFHSMMVTDDRITILTRRFTAVYDMEGTLIGMNDEQPIWDHVFNGRGQTSFVNMSTWVHLVEPVLEPIDPDNSFVQTHDLVLEAGDESMFTFEMPHLMENLNVRLTGTGDADLYVRFGEEPTGEDFDCAPYLLGSDEICDFWSPDNHLWQAEIAEGDTGTWYVKVVGFGPLSEVTVTVEAVDEAD